MDIPLDKTSWQDKRINAMNRVIGKNKYKHEYYIEEYCAISDSKAKNKQEYKKERKNVFGI